MQHAAHICLVVLTIIQPVLHAVSSPAEKSQAEQTAWRILGESYVEEKSDKPGFDGMLEQTLQELSGEDESKSRAAGQLLAALFRQAAADETNGRSAWRPTPYWGRGYESSARETRKHLAQKLEEAGPSDAAVELAAWLLENEALPEALTAATRMLETNRCAEADQILMEIVQTGTHWKPALVMALKQSGERKLKVKEEWMYEWRHDARKSVRDAANAASTSLQFSAAAAYNPEKAFTPDMAELFANVLAMLPDPPALDARFGMLSETWKMPDQTTHTRSTYGWLTREQDGVFHVLSWFGESLRIPAKQNECAATFRGCAPGEAIASVREMRASLASPGSKDTRAWIAFRGQQTRQNQPLLLTLPEALLTAWLFNRGDLALAAEMFFPLLDGISDDRWTMEILRDLIGTQCHLAMLDAFAVRRDYDEAIRLARHLDQPLFNGYQYQQRAQELATQLPARMEDFKTFTLPTATDWKEMSKNLPREKQVEYLASRLRLLNCFQIGQPGGVDYLATQFSIPGQHWHEEEILKDQQVINPIREILRLKLVPADIETLAPFLQDDSFMPTFEYWRDFIPDRSLLRSSSAVVALINSAAFRPLIEHHNWSSIDATQRVARLQHVEAWIESMSRRPLEEVLRINMREADDGYDWKLAAVGATRLSDGSLLGDLLAGAEKFPECRAKVAELCFLHAREAAVPTAQKWLESGEAGEKFYGALILIQHGTDQEKQNARKIFANLLSGDAPVSLLLDGAEYALPLDDGALLPMYCRVLRREDFDWRWEGSRLVHRLFLRKQSEALDAIVESLKSLAAPEDQKTFRGGMEQRQSWVKGDRVAEGLAWIRKNYNYPGYAPDSERSTARDELSEWIKRQYELLQADKPTPELETDVTRIRPEVLWWENPAP